MSDSSLRPLDVGAAVFPVEFCVPSSFLPALKRIAPRFGSRHLCDAPKLTQTLSYRCLFVLIPSTHMYALLHVFYATDFQRHPHHDYDYCCNYYCIIIVVILGSMCTVIQNVITHCRSTVSNILRVRIQQPAATLQCFHPRTPYLPLSPSSLVPRIVVW